MIDNRIYTFLELCSEMNYHKTAENLNMTQPAVTQHIKYLEKHYDCKLFNYTKKKLEKTQKCAILEKYAREIISLNKTAFDDMQSKEKTKISIGATKTIGEYVLNKAINTLFLSKKYELNVTIDNTQRLLEKMNRFEVELLLLEGFVDKGKYKSKKFSDEEMVGICAKGHEFAGKEVDIQQIFAQNIILREHGSGTRAVFEKFLYENGYNTEMFNSKSVISSNKLIEHAVQKGKAISFVYNIIPKHNKNLAVFKISNSKIMHEFNYVFLNEDKAKKAINLLWG